MRKLGIVCVLIAVLIPGGQAARRKKKRQPAVHPSAAIEDRINKETTAAEGILANLGRQNLFESPYVVSAVYYHDGLLDGFPENRPDAEPARRIISRILRQFKPELKARYMELLRSAYDEGFATSAEQPLQPPVKYSTKAKRRRRTHAFAIDLFVPEGTPVRAAVRGVVVLADGDWTVDDPFSTASRRGGNAVIVFNGRTGRFYRYCHLQRVDVHAGDLVEAGQPIGAVGHSGLNASRHGHGRHLHFEINQYQDGRVRPLTRQQIWALLP